MCSQQAYVTCDTEPFEALQAKLLLQNIKRLK